MSRAPEAAQSSLAGLQAERDLLERKVKRLVLMGGRQRMQPWDAVRTDLSNLAKLTGNEPTGKKAVKDLDDRLDALNKAPNAAKTPVVLLFDSAKDTVFTSGNKGGPQAIIKSKLPDGSSTTVYQNGPFVDLCMGPDLPPTGADGDWAAAPASRLALPTTVVSLAVLASKCTSSTPSANVRSSARPAARAACHSARRAPSAAVGSDQLRALAAQTVAGDAFRARTPHGEPTSPCLVAVAEGCLELWREAAIVRELHPGDSLGNTGEHRLHAVDILFSNSVLCGLLNDSFLS